MKKAKLDIWEDIPVLDDEKTGVPASMDQDAEGTKGDGGRKWATNKLLLISAPIMMLVLLAGILIAYNVILNSAQAPIPVTQTGPEMPGHQPLPTASPEASGQVKVLAIPEKKTILYFKDFMIDLKDARGDSHVLMCDVVFDLGDKQQNDQIDNTALLRSIIYKTAQMRSVVALRSVEERKKLKKDLAFALDKILGEGSVKEVYFMNYFIM